MNTSPNLLLQLHTVATEENEFDRINAEYDKQIRDFFRHYERHKEYTLLALSAGHFFGEEEVVAALAQTAVAFNFSHSSKNVL